MRENVLIVNADSIGNGDAVWRTLSDTLHYRIVGVSTTANALEWIRSGRTPFPDIVLLNVVGGALETLSAIQACKKLQPNLPVLVFIPYGSEQQGAEAVKAGAYDFIIKPVTIEHLQIAVQNALKMRRMAQYIAWLERKAVGHTAFEDIIGSHANFKNAIVSAMRAAELQTPVWLTGEPGTGKTLFARAIHGSSCAGKASPVIVNCDLLPAEVAGVTLFGQESPVTSEGTDFIFGKIREADQGTLVLQNPGSLPMDIWEKVVAAQQTGTFTPYGALAALPVKMRLICTDSHPAKNNLAKQKLCEKTKTNDISLPSLAERAEDIRMLAQHFLLVHATSENKYITAITERGLQWLEQCRWSGNVGELANTIWRAVMICENPVMDVTELRTVHRNRSVYLYSQVTDASLMDENGRIKSLKSVEQEAIRFALQQEGGCMTRAARSLGIGRSTLYRKVQELDIKESRAGGV
jgi:DNA-binding NtrC family response regulator